MLDVSLPSQTIKLEVFFFFFFFFFCGWVVEKKKGLIVLFE
jgi:hypothetical protein